MNKTSNPQRYRISRTADCNQERSTMKTILRALFSRRKFTVLAVAAALTLGTASVALAGTGIGGVFNLGKTNTVNAITKLTGSVAGSSLQIINSSTNAAATALDLQVATGKPPLKVNSTTKVTNLNADTVDGQDGSTLLANNQVRADGSTTSNPVDDFTSSSFTSIASKTFSAPSNGFVMITGSLSAEEDCTLAGMGNLLYRLSVDGTPVTSLPWAYELSYPVNCDSFQINIGDSGAATAVVPVSEGTHTISLDAEESGTGSFILGRSVTSVFVPTGSADAIPTLTTSKDDIATQNRN